MENNTNNLNENQNSNNVETNAVENKKKNFSIAALVLGIVALVLSCIWYISIPCAIWGTRIKIIKKRNVYSRNYNRCDRYGTFYIINCISFSIRFRYFEKCNR